jgi:hypothetical protein
MIFVLLDKARWLFHNYAAKPRLRHSMIYALLPLRIRGGLNDEKVILKEIKTVGNQRLV